MAAVILFPHTQIAIQNLGKILDRFGELTICQPWFVEDPLQDTKEFDLGLIHIQHPPEILKPKGDFIRLISEYQLWIRQNRDKGYRTFLKSTREEFFSEETPWEIRQLISKAGEKKHSDPREAQGFKWHLTLHLAREFEKNKQEADELLRKLRYQKSPLDGALEESPPQGFFEDASLLEAPFQVDGYRLRQVFEAWFGLFGGDLSDEGVLVTFDPQVLNYASEIFEFEETIIRPKTDSEKDRSSESASVQTPRNVRYLPQLTDDEKALNDPVRNGLSGKTIILLED